MQEEEVYIKREEKVEDFQIERKSRALRKRRIRRRNRREDDVTFGARWW